MTGRVVTTVADHVAHVRLNRPDKRNGLDLEMFEGIVAAAEQVSADRGVRAVVLSGEGKAFCAGLDWKAFMQMQAEGAGLLLARDATKSPANLAQRVAWAWVECPVPVIAAIHGAAFGGGLQIALGADVRLLAPDAELSVMEAKYGLIPDMGATQTLFSLVRPDIAKELMFTARVVGAEEAVKIGLGTRVEADPLAAAHAMAKAISQTSPDAVRAAKQLHRRAPGMSVLQAFELETELQVKLLGSPNQMAAVTAVMTKQPPEFT